MRDLQALQLFTRVARLGSFSAAARELGLSQPRASRIIAELEARIGVRLLARTTRAVKPTDAGEAFLSRMEPILAALDDAEASVREDGDLRGVLRIGMPASFGVRVVLPRLRSFADEHPKLRLEVMLDDRFQDMVREAVDVGIRVGARPDASGTSRALGTMDRVVVAAPSYLEGHGRPKSPGDLMSHRIIAGPASTSPTAWRFERAGATIQISPPPHLVIDDTVGAVAAAKGGLGIVSTTSWSCKSEVTEGSLVRVLRRWATTPVPIHAYFPAGRATRRSARVFVDFLQKVIHASQA